MNSRPMVSILRDSLMVSIFSTIVRASLKVSRSKVRRLRINRLMISLRISRIMVSLGVSR